MKIHTVIFNGQESGTRISYYMFPLLWKLAIVCDS